MSAEHVSVFTLADIIAKSPLGTDPDCGHVAVIADGEAMTYGDLQRRAERLAAGLVAAGFRHGDRMCVLMHNRREWLEIFFALARVGGVLVPVNHLLTARETEHIVDDSGATWFVSEDRLWSIVEGLQELGRTDLRYVAVGPQQPGAAAYEDLLATAGSDVRFPVRTEDLFLLQYTSGTTGRPKGAMHTQSTVMWNAISQRPHFALDRDTVYLCLPALSWVAGFHSLLLQTLWCGGTVVLNPTHRSFDAPAFAETVRRHGVTHVALVPTIMRRVLADDGVAMDDLASLRVAITGGESVPVHLLEEMHRRLPDLSLLEVYGMSEFPSLVTLLDHEDALRKIGSAGRANCVSQVRVVDERDRDLPPGEVGEIVTRSPATTVGYYGLPEATAAALRNGWFHTGDLGYLDEDGYLFISGRSKDLIISGGLNIYPAEIEHALTRHPAVTEAAVIGVPDERWGEVTRAIVISDEGDVRLEAELREFLGQHIARFKIPKQWEIRAGPPLPRTASGKLQKFKLTEASAIRE